MNVFNRIVTILLILAIMVLTPLVLIFPEQAEFALRGAADVVGANVNWLSALEPAPQIGVRLLLAAAGMLVFLVGLVLIVLQFVRFRRRGTVKLRDGSGELTTNGITAHLAYYIDMLPDVAKVKPVVQGSGKGVRVTLNVETAPGIDILKKSNQIRQTALRVLEEQLGIDVRQEVRVVLKPSSFPKLAAGAQMPPVIAEAIGEMPVAPTAPVAPAPQPEIAAETVADPSFDWVAEAAAADDEDLFGEGAEQEGEDVQGGSAGDELEAKAPPDEG
jgi:hypothetical protein